METSATDKQKEEQNFEQPHADTSKQQIKDALPPSVSNYTQIYHKKICYDDQLSSYFHDVLKKKFQNNHIQINEVNQFSQQIQMHLCWSSINKEIIVMKIKWGIFERECTILNISSDNYKHKEIAGRGAFGNIYQGIYKNEKITLKCLPIRGKTTRNRAIKEWFLLKIASKLEVGPQVEPYFGFDMLMYSNCVQFAMETCKPITEEAFNVSYLFWNMALLHKCQLVHLDIKPQNIMLSPSLNKSVFIDFGLSKFIKEKQGYKSWTNFIGTTHYCSHQMLECNLQGNKKEVDLYYNDLHSLRQSIRNIKNNHQIDKNEFIQYLIQNSNGDVDSFSYLSLYQLKFFISTQNIKMLKEYLNEYKQLFISNISNLAEFILEFPPTQQLNQIVFHDFADVFQMTPKFTTLKIIYEQRSNNLWTIQKLKDPQKRKLFRKYQQQYLMEFQFNQQKSLAHTLSHKELLNDKNSITKIQFQQYVKLYLKHLSFFNNKEQITSEERQNISRVFYELFISKNNHELNGRQLLVETIRYIFNWCCKSSKSTIDIHSLALIIFRLYDFVVILDFGDQKEAIKIINTIVKLDKLNLKYKYCFWSRVKQANRLNLYRMTKKGYISRFKFYKMIEEWYYQLSQQISKIAFSDPRAKEISIQFSLQFGTQILSQVKAEKMKFQSYWAMKQHFINIYNEQSKFKDRKFFYFLLQIYEMAYFKDLDFELCQQIYILFENNVADSSIQQQFIFKIQLAYLNILKFQMTISEDFMNQFSNHFASLSFEDFAMFRQFFSRITNRFIISIVQFNTMKNPPENWSASNSEYMSSTSGIFCKFVESLSQYYQKFLFENIDHRTSLNNMEYYNFLEAYALNRQIKSISKDNQNTFTSREHISRIKCLGCQNLVDKNLSFFEIKQIRVKAQIVLQNSELKQICAMRSLLFEKIDTVIDNFSREKQIKIDELEILQHCLRIGQYYCYYNQEAEQQFHGLLKYYQFANNYNYFTSYFKNNNMIEKIHPKRIIFATMQQLLLQRKQHFTNFLSKLTLQAVLSRDTFNLQCVVACVQEITKTCGDLYVQNFFNYMKDFQKNIPIDEQRSFASIYTCIFHNANSQRLRNKIAAEIIKKLPYLVNQFQRILILSHLIMIFSNMYTNENKSRKVKRKLFFYQQQLVKLAVIVGNISFIKINKQPYNQNCSFKKLLKWKRLRRGCLRVETMLMIMSQSVFTF